MMEFPLIPHNEELDKINVYLIGQSSSIKYSIKNNYMSFPGLHKRQVIYLLLTFLSNCGLLLNSCLR